MSLACSQSCLVPVSSVAGNANSNSRLSQAKREVQHVQLILTGLWYPLVVLVILDRMWCGGGRGAEKMSCKLFWFKVGMQRSRSVAS